MPLKVVKARWKKSASLYIRGVHYGIVVDESARTTCAKEADAVRQKREREIFEEVVLGKARERTFAEAVIGYIEGGGEDRYLPRIVAMIGEEPLGSINTARINKVAARLYPGRQPSTINRQVHTPISAVLRWAIEQEWTHTRVIRRPKQPKGRLDWRTPEEMEALIAACRKAHANTPKGLEPGPLADLVTFYLGTGARASEALALPWADVSPEAHRVTLTEDVTKAGYSRHIDLQPRVRAALPKRGEGRVWAWWSAYDAVNRRLAAVCRREGLKPVTCHVFRHTWATWRYAVTRDIDGLMKAGGWRSVDMVMRYVHAGTDDLKAAVLAHGWRFGDGENPGSTGAPSGDGGDGGLERRSRSMGYLVPQGRIELPTSPLPRAYGAPAESPAILAATRDFGGSQGSGTGSKSGEHVVNRPILTGKIRGARP